MTPSPWPPPQAKQDPKGYRVVMDTPVDGFYGHRNVRTIVGEYHWGLTAWLVATYVSWFLVHPMGVVTIQKRNPSLPSSGPFR